MKRFTALLAAMLVLPGCGLAANTEKAPAHRSLDGSIGSLQSAFNRDFGKKRAIFIASPT